MKIFITGVCGYLGSSLAATLASRGHDIFGIDNLMYEQDVTRFKNLFKAYGNKVRFIILDTRSIDLVETQIRDFQPDALVHFGDLSSVYSCNHNPSFTESVGVRATEAVIDFCVREEIPLIYNSTSSLYGTQKVKRESTECDELPLPNDLYCKTKLHIETFIQSRSKENPKFKFIVFRPATVFGLSPRFRIELLPNHFAYAAVATGVMKISELNAYRAFISVEQLCEIFTYVIEANVYRNEVYNIGAYNLSKLQVALAIQTHCQAKIATVPEIGDLRNLQISCRKFELDYFIPPVRDFCDEIKSVVDHLVDNHLNYRESNFSGLLNMPLHNWERLN
jgi:nucleoside-diphosphate-sugar epimerase